MFIKFILNKPYKHIIRGIVSMRKSGENNLTNEKVSKERMEYEEQMEQ